MEPKIYLLQTISDAQLIRLNELMKQLCPDCPDQSIDHFLQLLRNGNCRFWVMELDQLIIGSITLVWYPIPSGDKYWIEDVVIDQQFRGQGLSKILLATAIEYAKENGAKFIDLTSRPERLEANALYISQGFSLRQTNNYRLNLQKEN